MKIRIVKPNAHLQEAIPSGDISSISVYAESDTKEIDIDKILGEWLCESHAPTLLARREFSEYLQEALQSGETEE